MCWIPLYKNETVVVCCTSMSDVLRAFPWPNNTEIVEFIIYDLQCIYKGKTSLESSLFPKFATHIRILRDIRTCSHCYEGSKSVQLQIFSNREITELMNLTCGFTKVVLLLLLLLLGFSVIKLDLISFHKLNVLVSVCQWKQNQLFCSLILYGEYFWNTCVLEGVDRLDSQSSN